VSDPVTVRAAGPEDAPAMLAIYAPIVERTAISFELIPPTVAEFEQRVRATTRDLPWFVAEGLGEVVGYAYASRHADRAAYRWSVDTTIYVADRWRGRRVGTALYGVLVAELRALGYVSAYAGITWPNDASVALHKKVGFVSIGRFVNAGFKHGAWHDVSLWYLALREPPGSPAEPLQWPR
jgi:L-amino acid N-acyltransferase YncA